MTLGNEKQEIVFLKSRSQFIFLKKKRGEKGRDAIYTKHKDKLYFKMFKSRRNKRGNENNFLLLNHRP